MVHFLLIISCIPTIIVTFKSFFFLLSKVNLVRSVDLSTFYSISKLFFTKDPTFALRVYLLRLGQLTLWVFMPFTKFEHSTWMYSLDFFIDFYFVGTVQSTEKGDF
jgi:hypothetical protein